MCRKSRQKHLVLWAQAQPERSADKRREHANVLPVVAEHGTQVSLHVLHALCLIVDGEMAVLPDYGRAE